MCSPLSIHCRACTVGCDTMAAEVIRPRWPLLLTPCSSVCFYACYYLVLPALSRKIAPSTYRSFNEFNERCWRQNILSGCHTLLSVLFLTTALVMDPDASSRRLYPHESIWLYIDLGFSLGYFSFALPMSFHMAFILKAGFPYGSPVMVLHHTLVVVAQANFLLTGYPHFYMAASGLLFELTNVFFIPHVLMTQLQVVGRVPLVNGLLLVIVYAAGRAFACSALAVLSLVDLAHFQPELQGGWIAAIIGLLCFYSLLALSWYWFVSSILPALHAGLQQVLGDTYYHGITPAWLRSLIWLNCTSEGSAERRDAQRKLQALKELQQEMAMEMVAADMDGAEE